MKTKFTKFIITLLISVFTVWGLLAVMSIPARANKSDTLTSTVTVAGSWSGSE